MSPERRFGVVAKILASVALVLVALYLPWIKESLQRFEFLLGTALAASMLVAAFVSGRYKIAARYPGHEESQRFLIGIYRQRARYKEHNLCRDYAAVNTAGAQQVTLRFFPQRAARIALTQNRGNHHATI